MPTIKDCTPASHRPTRDIWRLGKHTLIWWKSPRMWTLWPQRRAFWHGELVHWQWLGLDICTDNRKDWLGDMMGTSEWAKNEKESA